MPESEPWEYSLHIPNDVRAVTVSRRTLRLILTVHGLITLVDVAELLAAELVANAVRHTKGPAALRVRWSPPGRSVSGRGTPTPPRLSRRRRSPPCWRRRTDEGSRSYGRAPTCGGGSPSSGTAVGGSSCGARWVPRRRLAWHVHSPRPVRHSARPCPHDCV